MAEEQKQVLYGVLDALTKDGLIRVGRQDCSLVDIEAGLYWPYDPSKDGYGDCLIGHLQPTVKEALKEEERVLKKELKELQKQSKILATKLEAIQTGLSDPTKIHLSKRSPHA